MRATECSCRLCPSPGMYAVTSMPFVRRTRAILRRAEFGFFGVIVFTCVQTPRFCGEPFPAFVWPAYRPSELFVNWSAGAFVFFDTGVRPLRTSWLIVGIPTFLLQSTHACCPCSSREGRVYQPIECASIAIFI